MRPCDALLLVLRAFESPLGENNPVGELNQLSGELVLADWELVEKRLERLAANKKKTADKNQEPALRKLAQALEEGKPARTVELTEEEAKALEGLELLSAKPAVVVVNLQKTPWPRLPCPRSIDEICAENLWPR